jgi:hypothetical protein
MAITPPLWSSLPLADPRWRTGLGFGLIRPLPRIRLPRELSVERTCHAPRRPFCPIVSDRHRGLGALPRSDSEIHTILGTYHMHKGTRDCALAVDPTRLARGYLDQREVPLVAGWCGVVHCHGRSAVGGRGVLTLHPVGVAYWGQVLVDEGLVGSNRPCDGVVIVVADGEHPGVGVGGRQ